MAERHFSSLLYTVRFEGYKQNCEVYENLLTGMTGKGYEDGKLVQEKKPNPRVPKSKR